MFCSNPYPSNKTFSFSPYKECYVDSINVVLNILFMMMIILVVSSYKCMKLKKKTLELVRYHEHSSRWILTILLFCINLIETGEGIIVNLLNESPRVHVLLSPICSLITTVSAILFYQYIERLNRPKTLILLFLFWPLAAIMKFAKIITLYGTNYNIYHLRLVVSWAASLVYCLLTAVDATLLIIQKYMCNKPYHEEPHYKYDVSNIQYLHPYVNLFSKATFSWMISLLKLGYQRPLELPDLEGLPEEEQADYQFRRFNEVFLKEKEAAVKEKRKISLWKCYWLTFWKSLFVGGIMKVMGDVVNLVGPLSISIVLTYVAVVKKGSLPHGTLEEPYNPTVWEFFENGFVMSVIVLVCTFLQSTFSNNFNHLAIAEGTHLRTALQCLVYKKALRMSSAAGLDTGALVNHMAVDAFNVMMMFSMGHHVWAVPLKVTLLLCLLYAQLGYSALIGSATVIFLVPIQYYICKLLSHIQRKALDISDERLKRTTELLQGIKLLKLYGWEKVYASLVEKVRGKELKVLYKDSICVAFNTFLTQTSSIILTLVTFSLFSKIEGRPLTPSDVFTGLALFNQLTVPLYIVPFVVPMIINAVVSTRRLVDFLMLPEVDLSLPWRENSDEPEAKFEFVPESGSVLLHVKENFTESRYTLHSSEEKDGVFLPELYNFIPSEENILVSIKKGFFSYDLENAIECLASLRDINLEIPTGRLTVVVGPNGSGKSSLLSAILGELHVISGSIKWNSSPSVAYVPQKPWLMNATIKENILFGQPYDGRRYHQVIQACALQPDIDLLPARDLTEVGERGLNLSGGQKQRIALARAFYSSSRLVILDDPLSALDAHVGAYVFEHGVKTLLLRRHRTVILVCHKLELLPSATKVILMESGTIKKQGSPKEMSPAVQELNASLRRPRRILKNETVHADGTSRERHKLVRLLSRQTLYRTVSSQDIKPRARLVSLSRQMSHDTSSPLACHDWGDHDDPLPPIADPDDPDTGHKLLSRMKSVESLRSRSTSSSASVVRRSWKCPPSRMNSRISARTEDLIQEEDEEEYDEESDEKVTTVCDQIQLPDGKLIKEEEREKGKISKHVYLMYMKACTYPLSFLVIFLIICTQAMKMGTDFWLSDWSELPLTDEDSEFDFPEEETEEDRQLHYYISIYAVMSVASIILAFITNMSAQLTSLKAVKVLHNKMLFNIVQCPLNFFDTTPVGRIINRFSSDMSTIDKKLPVTLPILMRFILLCLSAIVIDMIVTPYFIIVVIPVAAIYYFLQHFFRFTSRELQRMDCITKSPVYSHFSETVSGLSTIRAFRAEARFTDMIMACIDVNNTAFILVNCANCWLGITLDYLGGFILFVATLSSMLACIYGNISEAFVGMAMTYTLLVPIYLNWVVRNLASAEMYMSAVERLRNYSKLPIEEDPRYNQEIKIPEQWPEKGEICFQNVTMKYDSNSDPVLKNVTLTIKPGEKVGICGRTGSGKSSLIMALFRMANIMDGKIEIDGIDTMNIPLDTLRSKLSIIPQEAIIFSGTVRENLDPGNKYSDEELWKALEIAQLKHIISALPNSLDAQISDEGSNLSAGQHQLFCLARALIRKSKILVMDEATSALDPETDQILQNAVSQFYKNCTVLSIAHRIQSILDYDKVVILDSGHIAEIGNPRELQKVKGSLFASLVKASNIQH